MSRKHLSAATRARSGRSNHQKRLRWWRLAVLCKKYPRAWAWFQGTKIEAAGHLCSWIPLRAIYIYIYFIEFFWGATKKWLCDHCDYNFETLKANLPLAMDSVKLTTIRLWEHRMVRWMAAYSSGLDARNAQKQVKDFSSRKYTSHRRNLILRLRLD